MKNNFNIDLIIERSMAAFGCKTQRQLSDIFSISPENFSAKKKRGTLTKLIEKEAYRKGISYDWIITGEGNMRKAGAPIAESTASYSAPVQIVNSPSTGNNQDDYLTMTAAIIGTPSIFATALKSNIEAFHSGIRLQQELAAARAMLTIHDEQLKSQRERMNTLEDLIRQKEDKKAG